MRQVFALFFLLGTSLHALADELPAKEGFVDVPGGPVWYRITGSGSGVPLVVLHGGPGGTSCGYSRLEPLGKSRPIVRYDQLGGGRSGRPNNTSLWRTDRFVEELHSLRAQLGLTRMHLLGHSWGGALAAQYVLAKGSMGIESLILSSPLLSTADWIEDANALRAELPEDVQQVLREHEKAGTLDSQEYQDATMVFYRRHVFGGDRVASPASCDGAPGSPFVYQYMWGPTEFLATGNLLDFDVSARLGELELPVLFMAGEFDEAKPDRLREYQAQILGARLEIILDAAHASLSRQPARYREVVDNFLRAVEAEQASGGSNSRDLHTR